MKKINDNYLTVNGLPKVGTIAQAAKDFSLSPYSIRTWVNTGVLPAVRSGRKILVNYGVLATFLEGTCLPTEQEVPAAKYTPNSSVQHKGVKTIPPIF